MYRTTYDLLYRHEAARPNEMWQADHSLLDIWVRDGSGPLVRPWLTVIMDDYSRAIAGFRLSFQAPSAMQTALTLRQAIWRKSLPHWRIAGIPAVSIAITATTSPPIIWGKSAPISTCHSCYPNPRCRGGAAKSNASFAPSTRCSCVDSPAIPQRGSRRSMRH